MKALLLVLALNLTGPGCAMAACIVAGEVNEYECDNSELLQLKRTQAPFHDPEILEASIKAFESKGGLILSGTSSPQDIKPDHSGSAIRYDLPPMIATYVGLIFKPGKRPRMRCGYVVDGGTDNRENASGSMCGWAWPQFQNISVQCDYHPKHYAEAYYKKPMAWIKQYGDAPVHVWAVTQAACHFTSTADTLLAQETFWRKAATIPEKHWDQYGQIMNGTWSGPTGFNEIVFSQEVYDGSHDEDWVAIYWAHEGDFISNLSQTDEATRKGPCCISLNRNGKWCHVGDTEPVIEISNLDIVGWNSQYNYTGLQAYAQIAAANGYAGSNMFRVLPKKDICALDCSKWNATSCDGWS